MSDAKKKKKKKKVTQKKSQSGVCRRTPATCTNTTVTRHIPRTKATKRTFGFQTARRLSTVTKELRSKMETGASDQKLAAESATYSDLVYRHSPATIFDHQLQDDATKHTQSDHHHAIYHGWQDQVQNSSRFRDMQNGAHSKQADRCISGSAVLHTGGDGRCISGSLTVHRERQRAAERKRERIN